MICKEVRLLYYCVKRKCGKVCEALPYVGNCYVSAEQ